MHFVYIILSALAATVVLSSPAKHVVRQATQLPNGAAIEQTAEYLALPTSIDSPAKLVGRQATQSSNGAAIEQTAESLALPTSTASPDPDVGLEGVNDVDNNITSWAYLWHWQGCSASQKSAILNGLDEAHTVLGTDGVYNIDKHWNDFATVEYLGSPWYHKEMGWPIYPPA